MTSAGGKLDHQTMKQVVYRHLGAGSSKVIVGPGIGFDNAVISVGRKRVMIVTTDPVSIMPALGAKTSAWLSVHLIASDYVTSGCAPQFASFEFNFPPEMASKDRDSYLKSVGSACKELGISIVAGHTGSYPGAGYTVVGGGVIFGFASAGGYIDPSMSREGDAVVMTKGAAIESVASLTNCFPSYTTRKVGKTLAARAKALVGSCSTVRDALTAAKLGLGKGGVTSMHDATEGGVLGGLEEMAAASGHSLRIEEERILLPQEIRAVCRAFGIDPLSSLSEGTLLITCESGRADELAGLLKREGIRSAVIGSVGSGNGLWMRTREGRSSRVSSRRDGYWEAYAKASSSGLS